MQIYQDIWFNGVVQIRGIRDCNGRYRRIQAYCRKYNRPIPALDIGGKLEVFERVDFDTLFDLKSFGLAVLVM